MLSDHQNIGWGTLAKGQSFKSSHPSPIDRLEILKHLSWVPFPSCIFIRSSPSSTQRARLLHLRPGQWWGQQCELYSWAEGRLVAENLQWWFTPDWPEWGISTRFTGSWHNMGWMARPSNSQVWNEDAFEPWASISSRKLGERTIPTDWRRWLVLAINMIGDPWKHFVTGRKRFWSKRNSG